MASRSPVQVRRSPKAGEVVEVRIIIGHPMESGQRRNDTGRAHPAQPGQQACVCTYDGGVVFDADIGTGVAANPLFVFWMRATRSGDLRFDWVDDDGVTGDATHALTVVG